MTISSYPHCSNHSLIGWLHRSTLTIRSISAVVIASITWLSIYPLAAAAEEAAKKPAQSQPAKVEEDKHGQAMASVQKNLESLDAQLKAGKAGGPEKQALRALTQQMKALDQAALADFDRDLEHINKHKLSDVIRQRHSEAVAKFKEESGKLKAGLEAITESSDNAQVGQAVKETLAQIKGHTPRVHVPFDPNNLPFRTPDSKVRPPKLSKKEYAELFPKEQVLLADNGSDAVMIAAGEAMNLPTPADLAPTEDVQITPAIQAKSAELNHNPVEIYNWVHNNIEFIPTYGSIQGSDYTLQNLRGNAFDTSSLLVALLRASNIPARYVYGTVEIPVAKVMNWVGGVEVPNAAQQLLGQGGIPNRMIASGGTAKSFQMEHVWVEAWVDFHPSRGAKNIEGDSWVPMDGSFKQYDFSNAKNTAADPAFNTLNSLDELMGQIEFDAGSGTLDNLTVSKSREVFDEAVSRIEIYYQNAEAAGLEPVRLPTIARQENGALPTNLPYRMLAKGLTTPSLQTLSKRAFRFALFRSDQDRQLENPALAFEEKLPSLAGRRLSLQFLPSTEADKEALESQMPRTNESQPLNAYDVPNVLRGYLIQVTAVLLLDGAEIARAGGFTLGQETASTLSIQRHDTSWHSANNLGTAGQFTAIVLDLQGIGSDPLKKTPVQSASNLLHQTGLAYWSNLDSQLDVLSKLNQAVGYRHPSFGVFATELTTIYRYGIPRDVRLDGALVDVDASIVSVVSMDGDRTKTIQLMNQIGVLSSAMEHEVPAYYLTPSENLGQGASAVSALASAIAAGQRLYLISSHNLNTSLTQLQHSEAVKSDISAAIAAGMHVLISRSPSAVGSWSGAGYIVEDPITGGGAYRISGGHNGTAMDHKVVDALAVVGLGIFNIVIPPAAANTGDCGEQQRTQVDWQTILVYSLLAALLFGAILGSGGSVGPALGPALGILLVSVFLPINAALASPGPCPIYFSGATAPNGGPMSEATDHIAAAKGTGSPGTLTFLGPGVSELNHGWYNSAPECNAVARSAYEATHGASPDCDEYPFGSAYEGGELNYGPPNNLVSLRLISLSHNRRAGTTLRWFYANCGVFKNQRFEVRTTSGGTRGVDEKGAMCYGQ